MPSTRFDTLMSFPAVAEHISSSLLPAEECSWDEDEIPLQERGVRFRWLYYFLANIIEKAADHVEALWDRFRSAEKAALSLDAPEPATPLHSEHFLSDLGITRALVAELIVPLTQSIGAPLYARVPPAHRGRPSAFVSHTWSSPAFASGHGSFDIILDHHKDAFVWIDVACYNQHLIKPSAIAADMDSLIAQIGNVSFILTTEPFFTRSWCLWEILCAHHNDVNIAVHDQITRIRKKYWSSEISWIPPAFESVKTLKATESHDQENILSQFIARFGSVARADRYVRGLLQNREDLARYNTDRTWLGRIRTGMQYITGGR